MESVLVVISYTDFKFYCRPLFPKAYQDLTYPNKEVLFVSDENYPGLSNFESGDIVCARAREFGIVEARRRNFDYVFFMDLDTIPQADTLERLVALKKPFVGGAIGCRGDSTKLIGHTYGSWEKKDRYALNPPDYELPIPVDGISGASMLVHKSIFSKVGYDGYKGVDMIPGRTTCDDEFYCIKVHEATGERPIIHMGVRAWHLHSDGFAYYWPAGKRAFMSEKHVIQFQHKIYVAGQV